MFLFIYPSTLFDLKQNSEVYSCLTGDLLYFEIFSLFWVDSISHFKLYLQFVKIYEDF